ncbi:MAG: hypothetical protein BHV99_01155 [Clostridium sp. 26_21]|nr:MAG: hypothetical protein BHV99_01155 [Clostridium sp. 26_21]
MKINFKNNKGITGIDATIAVVILIIFVPLVTSLFGNIANTSKKINRKATATNIAIQAIEGAKLLGYNNINGSKLELTQVLDNANGTNGKTGNYTSRNIPNGYKVEIFVAQQTNSKDIIVNVEYMENAMTETLQLRTSIFKN